MEALKIILESEWSYYNNSNRPFWMKGLVPSHEGLATSHANVCIEKINNEYHIWFDMIGWEPILKAFGSDEQLGNSYSTMRFDDIDQAKKHVDQFLVRMEKLQVFL